MNKVSSIKLEGYKSIRSMELELRPLNVFIGANGAGKSNLISFFKLLSEMQAGNLQNFVAKSGGASSLLYYGSKRTDVINTEINFESGTETHAYRSRLSHAAGDILILLDDILSFDFSNFDSEQVPKSRAFGGEVTDFPIQHDISGQYKIKVAITELMENCHIFQFQDTSAESRFKQSVYMEDNQTLWHDGGNLAAVLLRIKQEHPEHYQNILQTIQLIAPFFRDFDSVPSAAQKVMLNWRDTESDMLFGPHQLSDGTLRFMALVTLLLQPNPPEMIIIDEPELGLHPYAISVLGDIVRSVSEKSQVMLSTQSPLLVDQFEPEDIIVVDRKDNASTFERLSSERLKEWLEDYSLGELWEKNVLGGRPA